MRVPRARFRYVDGLSFFQRIGRVDDDLIADIDSAENFESGSEIAPNRDSLEVHFAIFIDHRDLWSLRAK